MNDPMTAPRPLPGPALPPVGTAPLPHAVPTGPRDWYDTIDWTALGGRLSDALTALVHSEDGAKLYGADLYAAALKHILAGRGDSGLIPDAQAANTLAGHTVIDKLNLARAEQEMRETRERYRIETFKIRREIGAWLRTVINDRTVPTKYRREGASLAADWIDPDSPVGPYTRGGAA